MIALTRFSSKVFNYKIFTLKTTNGNFMYSFSSLHFFTTIINGLTTLRNGRGCLSWWKLFVRYFFDEFEDRAEFVECNHTSQKNIKFFIPRDFESDTRKEKFMIWRRGNNKGITLSLLHVLMFHLLQIKQIGLSERVKRITGKKSRRYYRLVSYIRRSNITKC